MFGRDDGVFVILAVGDFVGLDGQLVAVPFKSLKLDDSNGTIVLPGASQAALQRKPAAGATNPVSNLQLKYPG
jgi:hypothetical protein